MTTTDPHRSTTDLGRRSKGPDPFSNNLLATIVVIILLNLVTCLASAVEHPSAQVAKANRRKALDRQRRVIFNDDTYELSRKDANTPEGFLRRRLQPLTGTHVDTISWSVLGGWSRFPFGARSPARGVSQAPVRFAAMFSGSGFHAGKWWAKGGGSEMELGSVLEPLNGHCEKLLFINGLYNEEALKGNIHSSQTFTVLKQETCDSTERLSEV